MKRIFKFNWPISVMGMFVTFIVLFNSCQKEDTKVVIKPASDVSVALTPSSPSIVLDPTSAETTTAITLNWTAPNYGVEVSVTYTLEIDSMKGGFINPLFVSMGNSLSTSYTKKALNLLALSYKLEPTIAGQIQFRVKAEIGAGYPAIYSAAVPITITPYSVVIPPKYPVPDSLYLVGDATPGGWNNPVPIQSQHFTKIDATTFGIVVQLTGGKQYLFLPKNGDWSHKYNPPISGSNPEGDVFQPDAGGNNMIGPAASGLYKIIVDFVKGKYTATAITGANPIPANLFIVGDATAGQWNNPVPVPSQQFKQISNGEFQITIPLTSGKSYLFLPVNGDWSHKYGGESATGGPVLADSSVPNSNTPAPAATGNYLIYVNFFTLQYTLTKQ